PSRSKTRTVRTLPSWWARRGGVASFVQIALGRRGDRSIVRASGMLRASHRRVVVTQERAGRDIEFASNGDRGRRYPALPPSGRGAGVLVIQEWWGLVDHIRSVCDRLARDSFVALAPDLYRGETATDPDRAGRLMMGLEIPRAARDLDGAVAALQNHA